MNSIWADEAEVQLAFDFDWTSIRDSISDDFAFYA